MREALAEGVIDFVATDHAPHAAQDKDSEWAAARPGMLGLQTALSVRGARRWSSRACSTGAVSRA